MICACGATIGPDDTWCLFGQHPVVPVEESPSPPADEPVAVAVDVVPRRADAAVRTCPYCSRSVPATETECPFCQSRLDGAGATRAAAVVLRDGTRIPVGSDGLDIGRLSPDERISADVDRDEVSRRHARVRFDGATAWLADLGSTNGTWVGGRRVDGEIRLASGATVVALGRGGAVVTVDVS